MQSEKMKKDIMEMKRGLQKQLEETVKEKLKDKTREELIDIIVKLEDADCQLKSEIMQILEEQKMKVFFATLKSEDIYGG